MDRARKYVSVSSHGVYILIDINNSFLLCVYLFETQSNRERDLSLTDSLTNVRNGKSWASVEPKPGATSRFPLWVQGPKHLGHSSLFSQAQQGVGSEEEQVELDLMSIWDAGAVSGNFTYYVIVLAPPYMHISNSIYL